MHEVSLQSFKSSLWKNPVSRQNHKSGGFLSSLSLENILEMSKKNYNINFRCFNFQDFYRSYVYQPKLVLGPANTVLSFSSFVASLSTGVFWVYLIAVGFGGCQELLSRTPIPGAALW